MEDSKFVKVLTNVAQKVNEYKYIEVIKNAFYKFLPIIIAGAFGTLISNMIFGTTSGLASIEMFSFLEKLKPIADAVSYASLNFMTIGLAFLIGSELGKINKVDYTFSGLLAVLSYITVIPTSFQTMVDDEAIQVTNAISRDYTDASGLFLGMIIAILSVELYSWLVKQDKLQINLPGNVPPNVSASFSALFPAVITLATTATFGFIVEAIFGMNLYDLVYSLVQQPLSNIVSGLPGVLTLMLVSQVFWVIGIHGNQIIKPIREPILLAAIAENTAAFEAGEEIPNIINMPFWDIYMSIGGSGVTIGLIFAIFLVSKRAEYSTISRISLAPGLFNINETMTFGLPIVLNPILAIPFIITPLITGTIGYFATVLEFAGPAVVMIPWTTPPILSAYIATAGSVGAVVTQLLCILVATLIYLPFVKAANAAPDLSEEAS